MKESLRPQIRPLASWSPLWSVLGGLSLSLKKHFKERQCQFSVYYWFRFFCLSLVSSVRANGQTSALDSVDGGHTLYKLSWWNKILAITPTSLTQHHVSFFRNLPLLLYCSGYIGLERKKKRCESKLHSTHWVPLLTKRVFNLVKP